MPTRYFGFKKESSFGDESAFHSHFGLFLTCFLTEEIPMLPRFNPILV